MKLVIIIKVIKITVMINNDNNYNGNSYFTYFDIK